MRRPFALATITLACAAGGLAAQPVPAPTPPATVPAQPIPAGPPGAVGPGRRPAESAKKDEPTPARKRVVPDGPPEFEAKFVDDSVLKVIALDSTITLATKYGKLTVPLADIVRMEVGFRYPEGVEAKVEEAVTGLGSPSFREREEAEKALVKFAEFAVPALRRATKSPDAEVARRAEGLLKKLADKLPAEKLTLKDYDLIETPEATVRGRVETAAVKVKNRVIGETALRLTDVRSLRSTSAVADEFTVEAKYARQNDPNWFDTGVDVAAEQPLEITASGTVDLAPQQGGQFVSGPAGNPNNGHSLMFTANGGRMSVVPGALYARIGPSGTMFVTGTSHKVPRAGTSGRLYLKIAPSTWGGVEPTGGYKVKVKLGG